MNKTCKDCGVTKPASDFYTRPRMRDGLSSMCKPCECAKQSAYQKRPEVRERRNALSRARKRTPEQIRANRLWSFYRLRPDQFDALLESQGGRCANLGCRSDTPGGKGTWHIDHDHDCCNRVSGICGKCIRGILCAKCNVMIGMAKESEGVLRGGADYLLAYRTKGG